MSRQPQLTKDKRTNDITQIELKGHQTGNITNKNKTGYLAKDFVATTMCLLFSEIYKKCRFYQNFFDVRHIGATECLCSCICNTVSLMDADVCQYQLLC